MAPPGTNAVRRFWRRLSLIDVSSAFPCLQNNLTSGHALCEHDQVESEAECARPPRPAPAPARGRSVRAAAAARGHDHHRAGACGRRYQCVRAAGAQMGVRSAHRAAAARSHRDRRPVAPRLCHLPGDDGRPCQLADLADADRPAICAARGHHRQAAAHAAAHPAQRGHWRHHDLGSTAASRDSPRPSR